MNQTEYKWKVNGVSHKVYQVHHKTRGVQWCVWRDWKDETGYPHMDVEWFDGLDEALNKYPGALIQASLGI